MCHLYHPDTDAADRCGTIAFLSMKPPVGGKGTADLGNGGVKAGSEGAKSHPLDFIRPPALYWVWRVAGARRNALLPPYLEEFSA